MAKYYFPDNEDENICYTIKGHRKQMIENGETERKVFAAKVSSDKDYFFCHEFGEIGEKAPMGDGCGKFCSMYKPRNGKSGCCKYFRNLYESTGIPKIIKQKYVLQHTKNQTT